MWEYKVNEVLDFDETLLVKQGAKNKETGFMEYPKVPEH